MEAGTPWATRQDLHDLEEKFDRRTQSMDKAREEARKEHLDQHERLYRHIDGVGTKLEGKIDDWRKEQNSRIGKLEAWRIQIEAIMSVFTKGIRNRTLLLGVLVCVVIGGWLWMQTNKSLCELRDNNIHSIELSYMQGKVTEVYKNKQIEALKAIQC